MKKRHGIQSGTALTLGGLLLIAAALFLTVYNLKDAERAKRESAEILRQAEAVFPEPGGETVQKPPEPETEEQAADIPEPQGEMPEVEINGNPYIGRLDVPSLSLSLPVISRWSYPNLRLAPCRYQGSVYQDDLIIAAHNYPAHFGRLGSLLPGDAVLFTDTEGNTLSYTVTELETLDGTAIEEMESGDWDLTLFTCTLGGKSRVTVRCGRTDRTD